MKIENNDSLFDKRTRGKNLNAFNVQLILSITCLSIIHDYTEM